MNATTLLGDLAATIGSAMALSPLLQARAILHTRSSSDVSMGALWIFVVNSFAWLAYGVALGNVVLIIPQIVALGALSVAITVARRYRTPAERTRMPELVPQTAAR